MQRIKKGDLVQVVSGADRGKQGRVIAVDVPRRKVRVETVRRELAPWLTGRTVLRAERVEAPPGPKYADLERATGQRIDGVERRGKFLIVPLSGGDELIVHLGMTGIVSAEPPERHLRVRVTLDEGPDPVLYFRDARRFGRSCLVFTFVSSDALGVDYYQPDGARIDLGPIQRP